MASARTPASATSQNTVLIARVPRIHRCARSGKRGFGHVEGAEVRDIATIKRQKGLSNLMGLSSMSIVRWGQSIDETICGRRQKFAAASTDRERVLFRHDFGDAKQADARETKQVQ